MGKRVNLIGQRFDKLLVVEYASPNKTYGYTRFLCKCDCGTEKIMDAHVLKSGNVNSCGCYHLERVTKHGMRGTSIHNIWVNIRQRCGNPKNPAYKYYGGRGIKVCDEWQDFKNFYADMGDRPEGLTVERIDNDGNYEQSNCKWATMAEQNKNRRNSIPIDHTKYKIEVEG